MAKGRLRIRERGGQSLGGKDQKKGGKLERWDVSRAHNIFCKKKENLI